MLRLLLCTCLLLFGCDRLQPATVAGHAAFQHDSPCGSLSLSADQFIGTHYFLKIENRSAGALLFRVRNLRARQGERLLAYQVYYKNELTDSETLRIESGDAFVYDIQTGVPSLIISAENLFTSGTVFCSLDSIRLLNR